jgi:hypothetical protein
MNRVIVFLLFLTLNCLLATPVLAFDVPFVDKPPVIDGDPADAAWARAQWVPMEQLMWGTRPEMDDFSGRYKLVWSAEHLYLLAEITDDILYDSHPDPRDQYWEDDALEVFIDADASGGDHLFNYNAFAYHISLDNQAADIGPFLSDADRQAEKTNVRLYPDHVQSQWQRSLEEPYKLYWEVRITVMGDDYQDNYPDGQNAAEPMALKSGMTLGFMLAYCDSDGKTASGGREHFMGDVEVEPVNGDRNLGYIDASVFGHITLVE